MVPDRWAERRHRVVRPEGADVQVGPELPLVTGLERDAQRSLRLLREGATPGWQWSSDRGETVNVSYGRRLSDYPLVAVAAIALRWLVQPLDTRDVSVLLRSRCIGSGPVAGRARLELRLRELPDQEWRPQLVIRALATIDDSPDAADWIERLRRCAGIRREAPGAAPPSDWAALFDELLAAWGWPGEAPLDSDSFQLVNRWRDVLNELARLDLVATSLSRDEAVRRLLGMLPEIVFQPESGRPVINVIGPLEAAGMRFDKLWVSGLTAAAWPPPGRPLPLLSRELQRRHDMPDSTPSDTSRYARTVVDRLLRSAPEVIASYPRLDDGADQVATGLLGPAPMSNGDVSQDPGWAGTLQAGIHQLDEIGDEPVPAVAAGERIHGGATTLQNQLVDPFTAFAGGRLGIRWLAPIVHGLSPGLRGSAIHDALRRLFADVHSSDDLRQWDAAERRRRANDAARGAMSRYARIADSALSQLVQLEEARIARLLDGVIRHDVEREPFEIEALERAIDTRIGGVHLSLRIDRIDRLADGALLVLDYKTGARKRFLNRDGDPCDMQLVVYASALRGNVAALGLYNVDSREIGIDGAGRGLRELEDWHRSLGGWQAMVRSAAERFAGGDVRINGRTGPGEARSLNLLSRYAELVDDT